MLTEIKYRKSQFLVGTLLWPLSSYERLSVAESAFTSLISTRKNGILLRSTSAA
jgi:hypothetical protein